jgi:hypothetical protein
MAKFIVVHSVKVATDFVPQTFGRLTTLGPKFRLPSGKTGRSASHQVCRCECGKTTLVQVANLGKTKSCGCFRSERITQLSYRHGHCSSLTRADGYSSYQQMKERCLNPEHKSYHNYGGRGIRICDRWLDPQNGLENFLQDMGGRPSQEYSIERNCLDSDYCPENCRWATKKEQARNKRNTVLLAHNGKTQCVVAWAEELGIHPNNIYGRLRRGWSVEDTIVSPIQKK